MTELQDSFSEISRLVDSVAGPTAGAAPSEAETKVQRSEQARMLGERVRLMVLAEGESLPGELVMRSLTARRTAR